MSIQANLLSQTCSNNVRHFIHPKKILRILMAILVTYTIFAFVSTVQETYVITINIERSSKHEGIQESKLQGQGNTSILDEDGDDRANHDEEFPEYNATLMNTYIPRVCTQCFVRNFTYLLNPSEQLCARTSSQSGLFIIIMIPVKPSDSAHRYVIRNTWLSTTRYNNHINVRHVFMLGKTNQKGTQESLAEEQFVYGDLVQQDFKDSYNNLTLKSLMGFEWVTKYCSHADFILKVDADVFVNVNQLLKTVIPIKSYSNSVRGLCTTWTRPMRYSKWGLTKEEYRQEVLPPFCKGPRYLVPMKVAKAIVETAPNTPFIRLEDVYMGSVVFNAGFKVWTLGKFRSSINFNKLNKLNMDCSKIRGVTTAHSIKPKALDMIWSSCFKNNSLIS